METIKGGAQGKRYGVMGFHNAFRKTLQRYGPFKTFLKKRYGVMRNLDVMRYCGFLKTLKRYGTS